MAAQLNEIDWDGLERRFKPQVFKAVKDRLLRASSRDIYPDKFEGLGGEAEEINSMLKEISHSGIIERKTIHLCPILKCSMPISPDEISRPVCYNCGTDLREEGLSFLPKVIYVQNGPLRRLMPWAIAIHGMNTRGIWQEDFSWRIANKFYYHAPVLIYKYGLIRYGVLFRKRHDQLVKDLGRKIELAVKHAQQNGISNPPDVIVHSFGSLLFAKLLYDKDFNKLLFGRIIVTGGIVRPNFQWNVFIGSRVEAVFNHFSVNDRVVKFAQYCIPDAGPSGRYGFEDKLVLNIEESNYSHSSYFFSEILADNLKDGGKWDLFMRYPEESIQLILGHKVIKKWDAAHPVLVFFVNLIIKLFPIFLIVFVIWYLV